MDFNRILGPISSLAHSLPLFRSLTSVTVRRLRLQKQRFRGPLCALSFYYFDNYWAMPITPPSPSPPIPTALSGLHWALPIPHYIT